MPIATPTNLTSGGDAVTSTTFSTASVSPAANALVIINFGYGRSPPNAGVVNSVTSGFATVAGWTLLDNDSVSNTNNAQYRALTNGAPGSGTVTVDWSDSEIRKSWTLDQISSGFDSTNFTVETAQNTTTSSSMLASLVDIGSSNLGYSAATSAAMGSSTITPGTGETEIAEGNSGGGSSINGTQAQYSSQLEHGWGRLGTGTSGHVYEIGESTGAAPAALIIRTLSSTGAGR